VADILSAARRRANTITSFRHAEVIFRAVRPSHEHPLQTNPCLEPMRAETIVFRPSKLTVSSRRSCQTRRTLALSTQANRRFLRLDDDAGSDVRFRDSARIGPRTRCPPAGDPGAAPSAPRGAPIAAAATAAHSCQPNALGLAVATLERMAGSPVIVKPETVLALAGTPPLGGVL
jgi:hypothetical protein